MSVGRKSSLCYSCRSFIVAALASILGPVREHLTTGVPRADQSITSYLYARHNEPIYVQRKPQRTTRNKLLEQLKVMKGYNDFHCGLVYIWDIIIRQRIASLTISIVHLQSILIITLMAFFCSFTKHQPHTGGIPLFVHKAFPSSHRGHSLVNSQGTPKLYTH